MAYLDEKTTKSYLDSSDGASTSSEELEKNELQHDAADIEAQTPSTATEQTVSLRTKLTFLGAWFFLNLILTMSNKAVLQQASLPWLLTTVHTAATSIGCFALVGLDVLRPARLSAQESLILTAFSVLFTLNVATSNVSLAMVSIPLHQVMRSMVPVVTIIIYWGLGRTYSTITYLSLIPLVLGVALATLGDYYCTLAGFVLTALGVVLAAVKTIATNRLMTGRLALSPMEVLLRMSPLATIQCVLCAWLSGEVGRAHDTYVAGQFSGAFGLALVANGAVAFGLNIVSMQANKTAGALTMTVAGNVKQALTICLGIVLFSVQTGVLNGLGIGVTMAGAAFYSKVELDTKRDKARHGSVADKPSP